MSYVPKPDKDGVRRYGSGSIGGKGLPEDKTRCMEQVCSYDTRWPRWYQCQRKRTHGDFCKQHSLEAVAARKKAADDKYAKERSRDRLGWAAASLAHALREIMNGHNDPRALAREVLKKHGLENET